MADEDLATLGPIGWAQLVPYKPTPKLRWLATLATKGDVSFGATIQYPEVQRVLQQWWEASADLAGGHYTAGQWRDVPTEFL